MKYIRNHHELVDHGESRSRRLALECLSEALSAADTYEGTRRVVSLDEASGSLLVGGITFSLSEIDRIFVIGAGKGSFPIARALDEIIGEHIAGGIVMIKEYEEIRSLQRIQLLKSGHPVPDPNSLVGGEIVEQLAADLTASDLVFACMTGGCSALVEIPVDDITLDDLKKLNELLLWTGALIGEMNAVRKHVSRIKGGGLIRLLQPAQVVTLTQDTAPDSLPWPDPCLPDPSTFQGAIDVLKNYEIWDACPQRIRDYLLRGLTDPSLETPKSSEGFNSTYMFDTGNQRSACEAAVRYARKLGYEGVILSTKIEGESKDVGTAMAGIAKEIRLYNRPFQSPCVIVSAGETSVSITEVAGKGGPNQELVAGFARSISGYDGIVMAAIDSEGTDGVTDIAGGIADGKTAMRAKELNIDLFTALKNHDTSPALAALKDAIITGPTGTNVVNLRVLVIESQGE